MMFNHNADLYVCYKFGYKQAYGWIVIIINPNRVLQVNFHVLPHLTFDPRISWRPI